MSGFFMFFVLVPNIKTNNPTINIIVKFFK